MDETDVKALVRLVLTDATSGIPWLTGILTVVVAAGLGLAVDVSGFVPGWADPLNLGLTAVAFLCPLAAGGAAAQSSRLGRDGLTILAATAPRGPRAVFAVSFVSVLSWQVTAYWMMLGLMLVRSDLSGPFAWSMLLLPASAVAYIGLATALGTWVGSRFQGGLAAPVAALAVFLWIYVGSYASGGWERLSPIYPATFYQYYLQPNAALVATQALAAVAITCVAIASCLSRSRAWLLASACAVAAAVGLGVGTTSEPVEYRSPPEVAACESRSGTTVCVWPESREQLNDALDAIVAVREAAGSLLRTPRLYRQEGLEDQEGALFPLPAPGEGDYVFRAVLAASPKPRCGSRPSPTSVDAAGRLQGWLQARVDPSSITDPELSQLVQASPSRQSDWIERRMAEVRACR